MDNNNSRSNCDSGGAVESRRQDGTANTDRLGHLPEPIVHHILSFLDSKAAVQSSVLSRMWRFTWKHVPALHFRSDSFEQRWSFERYVGKVLSLRHPSNVRKMTCVDIAVERPVARDRERYISPYVQMIKYALCHNAQHLDIAMSYVPNFRGNCYGFSELFGTILDCNLESLELFCVQIDRGFLSSDFRLLTTLFLKSCPLAPYQDGDADPFSGFPCLRDLVLTHCSHWSHAFGGSERRLKISGPQLLSLTLEYVYSCGLEIVAPRLKFFRFENYLYTLKFSKLSFPSLDHAVILVKERGNFGEDFMESARRSLISLFQASSNVDTLMLDSETIKILDDMSDFLEQQSSPFTRLKSLIVKADSVPYALASYFLKGSSGVKPRVKFP